MPNTLKQFRKKLIRHPRTQGVIAAGLAVAVRALLATCRVVHHGDKAARNLWFTTTEPAVLAGWHGRILLGCTLHKGTHRKPHVLSSRHGDGQLAARAARWLGVGTISGSSSRGGAQALRGMLGVLGKGACLYITPDGPRGPRCVAHGGTVKLAELTGAPILPVGASATGARELRSWDRFLLPRPFSTIHVVWGTPLRNPLPDNALQALTCALNNTQNQADTLCGRTPTAHTHTEGAGA